MKFSTNRQDSLCANHPLLKNSFLPYTYLLSMPKRTFNPSQKSRVRRIGFRTRLKKGVLSARFNVIGRRRAKGRQRLTPTA